MGPTQYVAFLRAINVGGRVVKMTELKTLFERLSLKDVSTFIASGNVIFNSPKPAAVLAADIEAALQRALGYTVTTMLRTTREIADVAEHDAFPNARDGSLFVGFLRERADAAAAKKALALQTATDGLHMQGREIYWLARKGFAEATITAATVEKALQTPVTFRNINTVRRLVAKYPYAS
jgi:uncharacterized protein (DUF1697 family)